MRTVLARLALAVVTISCLPAVRASSALSSPRHPAGSIPADLPATFLAVQDHGTRLVLVDVATGRDLRVLVDLGPYRGPGPGEAPAPYIDGVALTPDRRTVLYSTGPYPIGGALHQIPLDGGMPKQIGEGAAHPSVSRDGAAVAYDFVEVTGIEQTPWGPAYRTRHGIAVRNLATGAEWRWDVGDLVPILVGEPVWAPDSRHLAFTVG